MADPGNKKGHGKVPLYLIPVDTLTPVAWVFHHGNKKYIPFSWLHEKLAWSLYFSALLRHIFAWWMGEDKDPESGQSHLAHVIACAMILLTYEQQQLGEDDRIWETSASTSTVPSSHANAAVDSANQTQSL